MIDENEKKVFYSLAFKVIGVFCYFKFVANIVFFTSYT